MERDFTYSCVLIQNPIGTGFTRPYNTWFSLSRNEKINRKLFSGIVKKLDKKTFKKVDKAKILRWTFRQLLLPSSAKDKMQMFNGVLMLYDVC